MEVVSSSEMFLPSYQTTQINIPEDGNFHISVFLEVYISS